MNNLILICQNPECLKEFTPKSSKAKYCCDSCRSKAYYMHYKEKYERDIAWEKKYKNNIKIIEKWIKENKTRIPKSVFQYIGLNPKIYKDYFESKGIKYFRIGEFAISIDPQDENYYQINLIK